jgi:valyl-tRNA synthetase
MEKNYDAKSFEDKWYSFWMKNGYFNSTVDTKKIPYTILQPPANVTSSLHLGHAINNTFQDILIRYKKLQGFNTLFLPGLDHGGLATEQMARKSLINKGIRKEELSGEDFLSEIWKYKNEKSSIITNQIKKLGCACDWKKEQFTLSTKLSNWVNYTFKQLYDQNMIYKSLYIINYCTECDTALSNDEVDYIDNKGKLYYIRYYLENSEDYIIVATTRPETLLGDTAIAYNPSDKRYEHLLGKNAIVPICNRIIPIIQDSYVKTDFGTGLVKITPSHDKDDYEIGKRHSLKCINIIDKKGNMFNTNTEFDTLSISQCRIKILEKLTLLNQIEKITDCDNKIGFCYRCKNNIETIISEQWFIKMITLREQALEYINDNRILFFPEDNKTIINQWLSNDTDWCISRQIVWGHQIPIWYCEDCKNINCSDFNITNCQKCNSPNITRDSDVLDTWFSSALWAFSVFDSQEELNYYFPSDVLITGSDILFFWVARMIMLSAESKKNIAFKEVFLHGIVRDSHGIKMSKSLGNGIDPMTIINEYSADILRFGMMYATHMGHDTNISHESFHIGKTFCTKLWNCTRYIISNLDEFKCSFTFKFHNLSNIDRWILDKMNIAIKFTEAALSKYDFGEAIRKLYSFIWDDFCNCYLEYAKITIDNKTTKEVLLKVLTNILLLLHPFIPFLTEELFQMLKIYFIDFRIESIMLMKWPETTNIIFDTEENRLFNIYKEMISIIRNVRGKFEIAKSEKINIVLISTNKKLVDYIKSIDNYTQKICRINEIALVIPESKYIIENHKEFQIYFPITNIYKTNKLIKNLENRIQDYQIKINAITENIKKCESTKRMAKFNLMIEEIDKNILNIKSQIEYYNSLQE